MLVDNSREISHRCGDSWRD